MLCLPDEPANIVGVKTRNVMPRVLIGCLLAAAALHTLSAHAAKAPGKIELPNVARQALVNADYRQGMVAFQTRCSA